MKYPQLVSTKAVNEISDWLIKRLEELDIEHPGVYSRLLLSLLHTPFKVNAIDLLEDLKEPYRFTNKNNEELKRLAAVESLMEVSAEENKSSIISLVEELHLKLRKFEINNCEESPMNTNSRATNSLASSPKYDKNNNSNKNLKKIKRNHGNESSTKNYYLAFPALNGNKKITTTTSTSAERKPLLTEIEESSGNNNNSSKKSNTNLLSWSNLMSNKKEASIISSSSLLARDNDNGNNRTPRRKRRCGKAYKGFPKKNDVQFTTKSFTMYDNATFSPKKMQMVKSSNRKNHQRNQYDASTKTINKYDKNCGIRNNNFSNAQNAPKLDKLTTCSGAPWDMDFKGHWEMDRDLISEFIQQQKEEVNNYHYQMDQFDYLKNDGSMNFNNNNNINNNVNMMIKFQEQQQMHPFVNNNNNNNNINLNYNTILNRNGRCLNEDEEDVLLMKCLPNKLIIDESLVDDPLNAKGNKPSYSKEALSISSLKSKFDENVKAIWSDVDGGCDTLKPLTHKHLEDEGSASLASSFTSEKNSLSLFNFNEQTHHFVEFNAPCTENYQQQIYKNIDYDCNNNNPMAYYGGRGAISKSSSFTASPRQFFSSDQMTKSDFIKSGTNLQTSIWSDSGDFTSDAESLIFKEVADPKSSTSNDDIYKNLSSIGAEMKQHWNETSNNNNMNDAHEENTDEEVTLFNHAEKSAFKKFRPIPISTTIIRANYHPLNVDYIERTVEPNIEEEESAENYLTSEKTHFEPIIRDGHTFIIDSNWDEIEYERSESGGLIYKNKHYRTWNKKKLARYNETDIDLYEIEKDSSQKNFVLKYAVIENNKECQTIDNGFIKQTAVTTMGKNHSFVEINEDYCKRKIYDEYFKGVNDSTLVESRNKWRFVNNSDDSNDYSFFTVNRVKNNTASNNSNNNLSSQTFPDILLSSNSSSSSICTITSSYDASESWRNVKVDGNNMIDSEYNKQTQCMHRLWEQCLSCAQMNEDPYADKSLPANRLMKDELKMDGDEIMNVIQNLYITSDYCDDDEKEDDCEEFDMNHVYMNMIMDDSMDGTCTIEEDENKFYETNVDAKNQKNLTSAIVSSGHHKNNVFNLENFDEITLTHWQWNKNPEKDKNHEKYLKLLNWIKESLVTNNFNINNYNNSTADTNNNDCQNLNEVHRPKNRKRRHSTCQNLLENKRYHTHEDGFTYHLNLDTSTPPSFLEDPANNYFIDAAKMLKVNIEKILLIHADPCFNNNANDMAGALIKESQYYKDQVDGANYYRNILQQQHTLIKQLDLSRPLTR
ncbi:homeobox protein 2-like [Chironomus tepperi]|uniref:homeobox protein 2-like n=1 Tax=Chironomus tepperi TaxID=113505 RepID=UPI00391F0E85